VRALVWILALCLPLVARAGQDALPWELRVPRMDRPRAQLAHARRIKASFYRRPEADRPFWRTLAVEAYQAVRVFHPEASEIGAEAAFRAGELLRAGGEGEAAVDEFRVAQELGRGTPFRARARLEIGHVHRREARRRAALDEYLAVAGDAAAEVEYRDAAWIWAGRVWQSQGRLDDARRAWKGVAEGSGNPLDRAHAYDELGLSWIEEGDLERARRTVEGCLAALGDTALEETERGRRMRSALLRMRTRSLLDRKTGSSASKRRPRKP